VLSVPFVVAVLYTLHDLAAAPGWGRLARAVLVAAATVALYTELTLILAGLAAVVLGGGVLAGTLRPRAGLALSAAVPVLTLAVNPGFLSEVALIATDRAK